MFVNYNPNPAGKSVGDCVVRAIAKLTNSDWERVFVDLAVTGLELCDMPSANAVWGAYLKRCGFRRKVLPDTCPDCYTVKDFCTAYPVGKYLLSLSGHVVAVCNGDYYDAWDSGNETPLYVWEECKK